MYWVTHNILLFLHLRINGAKYVIFCVLYSIYYISNMRYDIEVLVFLFQKYCLFYLFH